MAYLGRSTKNNQVIEQLIDRANLQGYLSVEDILEICPEAGQNEAQLEALTGKLQLNGVDILVEDVGTSIEPGRESESQDKPGIELAQYDDTVSLYLKEMALTPLLSIDEELSLAKRIENARMARKELTHFNGKGNKRRRILEAQVQDGLHAREALIKANTRLVVSIARRYIGRGVPFLDLIQEGNLGLMKAVEKFEYQRGFRFSTYATWWIRQGIVRSVADQGRTIRVPVHVVDRLRKIYKATREMEQRLGRTPTSQELADHLEIDKGKLHWMMQVAQTPVSLESPLGDDDEGAELGMYVEDITSPSPAQMAYENMLRERLDEVLASLSPREARVLRLRYGLGHDRAYTLEEVGQKFGLTRERIRQIEGKALRRLRQHDQARLLREGN